MPLFAIPTHRLSPASVGNDDHLPAAKLTTVGKLFTRVCLCYRAVQFGTSHAAVMPYGWEGNRGSGVAAGHAPQTLVVYRPTGSKPK